MMIVIFALELGACASGGRATVSEQGKPLRQPEAVYRDVVGGDTLYSIAWESGRDYRELALWNDISPPYTIKPGQKIRLHPPDTASEHSAATQARANTNPNSHRVQPGETLFGIATRYDVAVTDLASWNGLTTPYLIKPGQTLQLAASTTPTIKADKPERKRETKKPTRKADGNKPETNAKVAAPATPAAASFGPWVWPAEGRLAARASGSGASKGIDIGGKPGQAVVAAASGSVVYQGSGLRGYGQLIIVKHSADFLSAYAHCDKIVVREGNVIKRGQKIAEMESSTDRAKLHFEIRYRGSPVDPLDFLPKK